MLRWVPYAFIRITAVFIAGILSAIYLGEYLSLSVTILLSVGLVFSYLILAIGLNKYFLRLNTLISVIGFLTIFLMGYLHLHFSTNSRQPTHIIHHSNIEGYEATVSKPAEEKAKTIRYLVAVERVQKSGKWREASGNIYLYVSKDDSSRYSYGDKLLIHGPPEPLKAPRNPGEFDYKRFLSFRNIYHQQFVRAGRLMKSSSGHGHPLLYMAFKARQWCEKTLTRYIVEPREQSIALALILGVKSGLDSGLTDAYAASGAMHVLAVSGLHVGIIYAIIMFILRPFRRNQVGMWITALIALLVLWSYAAITGFSPSVLRAVTMFSFIILADTSERNTNIYNTLAASGFMLLLIDPYLIMSVGFQLSFLAVLGIVYLQPRINAWLTPTSWLADKVWTITSVAIAAQLATFPLGLLYFHQFPSFFFLSNLVVIPGAFIILVGGLMTLAISFFDAAAIVLGKVLGWFIWCINEVVLAIGRIPYSRIEDIYITTPQTLLIMGGIISFLMVFYYRKLKFLYVTLVLTLGFAVLQWQQVQVSSHLNKMIFYSINNHTAIDVLSKGRSILVADSAFLHDAEKQRFHVRPNHLMSGVMAHHVMQVSDLPTTEPGVTTLSVGNTEVLILRGRYPWKMKLRNPVKVDVVLLAGDFNRDICWLETYFKFSRVVFDGSLRDYRARRLQIQAEEEGVEYHWLDSEGAYEVML